MYCNRFSITFLVMVVALMTIFNGAAKAAPITSSVANVSDRQVTLSGTIQLQDYETFSNNEHAAGNFNHVVSLSGYQPAQLEQVPSSKICAGGEVWAVLDITVARVNEMGDVSVAVEGRLYEGSSCGTTDLDGTISKTFHVQAGQTAVKRFAIWNTDEDQSEDRVDITLTVFNGPADIGIGTNPLTRKDEGGIKVGSGWNFTHYLVGNWTGNGTDDLIVRTQDGDILLYPSSNNTFYVQGAGTKVGSGWNFTHYFVGDWTRDGIDDLIVRTQTGDLLLYPFINNTFYVEGAGTKVASGLNFTHHFVGNWTGDGTDALIVRTEDGDMLLYPFNNIPSMVKTQAKK